MKYLSGRNNLALTLFVPWDCGRNCPFCTTKKDYSDTSDFSLVEVVDSTDKIIESCGAVKDLVITGGEPFADLKQLKILLNSTVHSGIDRYINTTLDGKEEDLVQFIRGMSSVSGINVSRHIPSKITERDITLFNVILRKKMKVRINSVVSGDYSQEDIKAFIDSYAPYVTDISFRYDYRKVKTQDDLRSLDNAFLKTLAGLSEMTYKSSGGCHVCNNDDFVYKSRTKVTFHRGMESTKLTIGDTVIVNDIIVKQNGKIQLDWESEPIEELELENLFSCLGRRMMKYCSIEELGDCKSELSKNARFSLSNYVSRGSYIGSCGGGGC